ncbi:NAD(P)/FAD-dependent oxidoreductase [Desulfuromonas thiophila]|uniref:dihydrolipoyl dehydrogenase family protein n=1 Tax=Desulfuromonas thiophila TaxID=57664 RepID=UPI0029F45DCE|nr:NAD(P)/FAD-dependent oxidoreductase [Desulfuromonas thiophila]
MTQHDDGIYDLCILGGGPGGFAGAMRAFDFGKRVCLVEGGEIGGAGVKWGALASKTLWELAKDYSTASKVDRGYRVAALSVSYAEVAATVEQAVKERQYQMLTQLESFSPQRWNGPGSITLMRGWATFNDGASVRVYQGQEHWQQVRARNFLIATGSRPRAYPGIQIDQQRIFDSNGIGSLKAFPKRLLIVGAGVVGCEYASIFAAFGQTQVHLVDHKERVIPYEDRDVSTFVEHSLRNAGVELHQQACLREVRHLADSVEVILDYPEGRSEVLQVDAVLVSVGRRPNLEYLNLTAAGVAVGQNGYLETGVDCCAARNIYACGDVTCHPNLVNIAEMEARLAVRDMFGQRVHPLNYQNMSAIMFFNPAIATVGLSEESCQKKGLAYRVAWLDNALVARAIAMRATRGFTKIVVSDDEEMKILGMRAAGPQVANSVMAIAHFMDHDKGAIDVLRSVYPHPTISEATQECLRLLLGKSVYKPYAFPQWVKVRRWKPNGGYAPL